MTSPLYRAAASGLRERGPIGSSTNQRVITISCV
ncbi:hypothetical protein HNR40_007051 [Nonomuraea endophytica]|uniref:Uncharacterized protein n=1 Tax=Nonomuraea endophytica TaxID=714136 RepID=A0A7W8A8G5_9ACTN|nr:hypothetical protein [Nonomuraea endophytica]